MHFSDRLAEAIRRKGSALCVGIDPRWESLPKSIRESSPDPANAFATFSLKVLDLVADRVAIIKPQMAFFEGCGPAGLSALQSLLNAARDRGLISILDSKRGDIASTATAYAQASFRVWGGDSLTVNPYLGRDAVQPFLDEARQANGGIFVLVRTSNPGSGLFQNLLCDGKPLYEHVGQQVALWSRENLGACGLGDVGAVVGATHPQELIRLRELLPEVWFLVPGFGAQGGTAADVQPAFRRDGLGAIINSSRGITFPFHPDDLDWEGKILSATEAAIAALGVISLQ
jgi:orotidine-5'-phosphate decarboxylase